MSSSATDAAYADLFFLAQQEKKGRGVAEAEKFDITDVWQTDANPAVTAEPSIETAADAYDDFELSLAADFSETFGEHPVSESEAGPELLHHADDSGSEARRQVARPAPGGRRRRRFASFRSASSLIGIDWGKSSVKFLVARKSGAGYRIENLGIIPLPTTKEEGSESAIELEESWQRLRRLLGEKDRIVSCLSGLEVVYRVLEVPKISKKELAGAIPWALRKDLPFEIDQATVAYDILGDVEEDGIVKVRVAALATPLNLIESHLRFFVEAKRVPTKITSAAIAVWNIVTKVKGYAGETVLAIDFGATTSHLVFVHQAGLDFHRELKFGCNDFLDAAVNGPFSSDDKIVIDAQSELPERFAREGLRGFAAETDSHFELGAIDPNVRHVLDRLVHEIHRSIDYYKEKFRRDRIDRVLLLGGGAAIREMDQALHELLSLSVESFRPDNYQMPIEFAEAEFAEQWPRFAIAFGLAIDDEAKLNLLPRKFKKQQKLARIGVGLRYVLIGLALLIAGATLFYSSERERVREKLQAVTQDYTALAPKKQEFLNLSRQLDALTKKIQVYRADIRPGSQVVEHLRAISNLVPEQITLTSITIEPVEPEPDGEEERDKKEESEMEHVGKERITLRGVAFPDQGLEGIYLTGFLLDLQASGYFQEIEISGQEINADGKIGFVIHCYF